MRSALVTFGLLLALAAPASAGELVDTCGGVDPRLTGACRGPEVFVAQGQAVCRNTTGDDETCTTPIGPKVSRKAVERHAGTRLHRALALQYELGSSLPFRETPWLGTHNSFNSASEMVTPSQTDANQQLSMTDQLRIDMRTLELDVHWFGGRPVLCHARSSSEMHAGCSVERSYEDGLNEIARWLDANPGEVVLLYVEDHLDDAAAYDATAAATERALGDRVYRPAAPGCLPLAKGPSREEVRDAGAQVILISTCQAGTAWGALHFDDGERAANEGGSFSGCPGYRGVFKRFFEDSTGLSAGLAFAGGEPMDEGLTPEITARMVRCGVDMLGFDQILPDDGRLEAAVWSWAEGHPAANRKCAVQTAEGFKATDCGGKAPYACRAGSGWTISDDECATFDVPRTGYDARRLIDALEAAGEDAARIALRLGKKTGWAATA
jgi:hypothetical protein